MSVKSVVLAQYRQKVNEAASKLDAVPVATEGWICTVRKALGMSAATLARRLKCTRAFVSNTEKSELDGSVTLRTMAKFAESLNCQFVYAIVPNGSVDTVLDEQAFHKARLQVQLASTHMALEAQTLNKEELDKEIIRIKELLKNTPPTDFWEPEQ